MASPNADLFAGTKKRGSPRGRHRFPSGLPIAALLRLAGAELKRTKRPGYVGRCPLHDEGRLSVEAPSHPQPPES